MSRLKDLIDGKVSPDNEEEELFMMGANIILHGQDFFLEYMRLIEEFETLDELKQWVAGYAAAIRVLDETLVDFYNEQDENNPKH